MSTYGDRYAASALGMLTGHFGEAGEYWDPGAESVTTEDLTIVVDESPALLEFEGPDEMTKRGAVLKVAVAALASPALDGRFVVGSDIWVIVAEPIQRNGRWRCTCEYAERETIGKKRRGD